MSKLTTNWYKILHLQPYCSSWEYSSNSGYTWTLRHDIWFQLQFKELSFDGLQFLTSPAHSLLLLKHRSWNYELFVFIFFHLSNKIDWNICFYSIYNMCHPLVNLPIGNLGHYKLAAKCIYKSLLYSCVSFCFITLWCYYVRHSLNART